MVSSVRPQPKLYHMADMITDQGDVSPLCASRPRKIDLRRASWTIRSEAVTCQRCKMLLLEKAREPTDAQ